MGSRAWLPVLGWCVATLTSIGLATVALQPVLRTAAPEPPAPPALPAAPPVVAPTTVAPTASPAATPSASPAAPEPVVTPPPGPDPTPPATVVDGWTLTTGAGGEPTYTRTFRVEGGQAVIRMTPGQVQLVTATPNPGYTVDVVQNEPGNLAVQFTGTGHYSIVHAIWQDGPVALVSEAGG